MARALISKESGTTTQKHCGADVLVRYALTEGFGMVSERIIRDRFFHRITEKYGVRSVLEVPANGSSGLPGINSAAFAEQGLQVTIANADKTVLEWSGKSWQAIGLEVRLAEVSSYERLPFRDNEFELVWNYCAIENFQSPIKLLKEMTRVSSKFVLIMVQNSLTYGYFIHRIYHRYFKKPWNHGNPQLMRIERITRLTAECNLRTLETGLIDAPPFPDTWELMVFPVSAKKDPDAGIREFSVERKIPLSVEILYRLENSLPNHLKLMLAHHPYVLAGKDIAGGLPNAQE